MVAFARSKEEFGQRVEKAATELDCVLLELEHIELLDDRVENPQSPEELIDMRNTAHRQPSDIIFGMFYTWVQSDEN